MPNLDPYVASLLAVENDIAAGRLQEAAAALAPLQGTHPNDPRVYMLEGMRANAAQQPKRAMDALQRALALAPDWSLPHMELALCLSRLGNHDAAVREANKAVALAPNETTVLETAVSVALAAGNRDIAERHLQSAHSQWPNNMEIRRILAICMTNNGHQQDAIPHWQALLEKDPHDAVALGCLGECLLATGRSSEGKAILEQAVTAAPDNEVLRFHLAIARGETPPTQPLQMTVELFDRYAGYFDKQLVGKLKYRLPRRVAEILHARYPDRHLSVLDLGCGTGLTGVYLGKISGPLIGVDVSSKMLDQAAKHRVYTTLRQNDLLAELRETAADTYDCVTANDVFIYVGDLSEVIPAVFPVVRKGGVFIFSCESADEGEGDLVLRPSKRYAHSRSSIERLCQAAGFGTYTIEPIDLRFDNTVAIAGFIAVVEKA